MREPVRFADSLRWLLERNHKVFLEVGPGSTLLGLAQQSIPRDRPGWVASLPSKPEWPQLLQAVASLYVGGATPDFTRFFQGRDARRVVAPTYPFEGKALPQGRRSRRPRPLPTLPRSCGASRSGDPQALTRLVEAGAGWSRTESDLFSQFAAKIIELPPEERRTATHASLLHEVEWRARARGATRTGGAGGTWLLLADRGGVAESLARELERRGETAIVARPDKKLSVAGRAWTFDPLNAEHCGALAAALGKLEGPARPRAIVHLLGLGLPADGGDDGRDARRGPRARAPGPALSRAGAAGERPRGAAALDRHARRGVGATRRAMA